VPKLSRQFYTIESLRASAGRLVPRRVAIRALLAAGAGILSARRAKAAIPVETLRSVEALPPHVAGTFREAAGFVRIRDGYLVFDRRGHTVYRVDESRQSATPIVSVGPEEGRLVQPVAFSVASDGSFVVADAPFGRERVQLFAVDGTRLRGFVLPRPVEPLVQFGGMVLNGVGSLQYDGESIYVNDPRSGSLVTVYSVDGMPTASIGRMRPTGFETSDPDLHRALNTGLPVANPQGGFYFVFQTGEPRFRKYDAKGTLVFERAVQGRELDPLIASQPTQWLARQSGDRELPMVQPIVRTAAVDRDGQLWIAFTIPFIYMYDRDGDKRRVVQLSAAGTIAASSLSFEGDGRVLVTPGCYIFDTSSRQPSAARRWQLAPGC
jgi:hypothetical protein